MPLPNMADRSLFEHSPKTCIALELGVRWGQDLFCRAVSRTAFWRAVLQPRGSSIFRTFPATPSNAAQAQTIARSDPENRQPQKSSFRSGRRSRQRIRETL